MTVTKREIIFSVIIVSVFSLLGLWLHGTIEESMISDLEVYTKALRVEEVDMFNYARETNVGNILVYDDAITLDPVSLPELSESFTMISRDVERYTQHIEEKTYTDSDGNTRTEVEVTYSWDLSFIGSERKEATRVSYMGDTFNLSLFGLSPVYRLHLTEENVRSDTRGTIYNDYIYKNGRVGFPMVGDVRYSYSVIPTEFSGTMFALCNQNGMENNETSFYYDTSIEEVLSEKESGITVFTIFFVIFWIILMGLAVAGFCYLDNNWLESKRSYNPYHRVARRNVHFSSTMNPFGRV